MDSAEGSTDQQAPLFNENLTERVPIGILKSEDPDRCRREDSGFSLKAAGAGWTASAGSSTWWAR
jgi:hypothetical protein